MLDVASRPAAQVDDNIHVPVDPHPAIVPAKRLEITAE
jgi:hypothetical protein